MFGVVVLLATILGGVIVVGFLRGCFRVIIDRLIHPLRLVHLCWFDLLLEFERPQIRAVWRIHGLLLDTRQAACIRKGREFIVSRVECGIGGVGVQGDGKDDRVRVRVRTYDAPSRSGIDLGENVARIEVFVTDDR